MRRRRQSGDVQNHEQGRPRPLKSSSASERQAPASSRLSTLQDSDAKALCAIPRSAPCLAQ